MRICQAAFLMLTLASLNSRQSRRAALAGIEFVMIVDILTNQIRESMGKPIVTDPQINPDKDGREQPGVRHPPFPLPPNEADVIRKMTYKVAKKLR